MSVLVVDVGTTDVRASVVRHDGRIDCVHQREMAADSPAPGLSEFDATEMAAAVLDTARSALDEAGSVDGVGIACQRASTIVWDCSTGDPVGPGLGWQDIRTAGMCLELHGRGMHLNPSQSATKIAFLVGPVEAHRRGGLRWGTVDTWVAWTLSEGELLVEDASNAAVTGLVTPDGSCWDERVLDALELPWLALPTIVDTSATVGRATALRGAPPISGIVGDQQASLVGQGCIAPGAAKVTFGTGGMLDLCVGETRPAFETRGTHGTFPIVAWRREGRTTWGVEATMLSAGTCMEWLRDDLGIIGSATECDELAASCEDSGGTWFVPALFGLGTPEWDYGARGTLLGITRGTGRPQVARAVLEGIAHRGIDLVEAAEADAGCSIKTLRVDGGMSKSAVLTQALADAGGRPVEVARTAESTTLGAGFLAGVELGMWSDLAEATSTLRAPTVVAPRRTLDRPGWTAARQRALRTIPELSALEF